MTKLEHLKIWRGGFLNGATKHVAPVGMEDVDGNVVAEVLAEISAVDEAALDAATQNPQKAQAYTRGVFAGLMAQGSLNPDTSIPLQPGEQALRQLCGKKRR